MEQDGLWDHSARATGEFDEGVRRLLDCTRMIVERWPRALGQGTWTEDGNTKGR